MWINQAWLNDWDILVLIDTWWNVNTLINTCLLCIFTVLIDTWWNVNRYADGEYLDSLGFNRYMVECEYAIADDVYNAISGFNRYMVECEFAFISHCKRFFRVLIDTWWNVNWHYRILFRLWGMCFNRYMVECEFYLTGYLFILRIRFNRYMVECESRSSCNLERYWICFNRYMVECEWI